MELLNTISKFLLGGLCAVTLYQLFRSIRMVPTKTVLIVERLGKYHASLNPGLHILFPFIDTVSNKLDLKEEAISVEPQECFTYDNVLVEVDGIIYISIVDPVKASYGITNYRRAAIELAQTTTRSIIGTIELDKTFEERELISARVVDVLSEVASSWGIMVHRYEVKNIDPPSSVRDAMEKQMTAERDKRALLAVAEGERQSNINESEGILAEIINLSEAEKQKKINEAMGKAKEIESLAYATADSISKVASAISETNGEEAINMRLTQQYLNEFSKLAKKENNIILPMNIGDFEETIKGIQG